MRIITPEWIEAAKKSLEIPMSKHIEMAEKNLRGIQVKDEKKDANTTIHNK